MSLSHPTLDTLLQKPAEPQRWHPRQCFELHQTAFAEKTVRAICGPGGGLAAAPFACGDAGGSFGISLQWVRLKTFQAAPAARWAPSGPAAPAEAPCTA